MYQFHQSKCQNRTSVREVGFVRLIMQIIDNGVTRDLSQGEILAEGGPPADIQ